MRFGYSPEQAYLLLGAAPIEGRLSSVVDIPNACATVYLPTDIFEFDITPGAAGPQQVASGQGVPCADPADFPDHRVLRAVPKKKRALMPPVGDVLASRLGDMADVTVQGSATLKRLARRVRRR